MGKISRRTFPVKGMGCAACVARVEGALKACPGVKEASVSLATSSARVDYDSSSCSPEGIRKAVQDAGYDLIVEGSDEEADSEADQLQEDSYRSLRKDTILAAVLSAIVMLIGMGFREFPGKGYVLWALATPVVFWCGRRFFLPAAKQIRHGGMGMDTLVSLSVLISYLFSVVNLLFPRLWTSRGMVPHLYFESGTMIVTFILLGRLLEDRAKRAATRSVRSLRALQPSTVTLQKVRVDLDGFPEVYETVVPLSEVCSGDIVVVHPGDRVPVDGTVTTGSSYVDESMLTGEPVPVFKDAGASVYAGTMNEKGSFNLKTVKAGGDTLLASIIKMVRGAQDSKAPVQEKVDKVAAVFVPVILAVSVLTLVVWLVAAPSDALAMGLICMVSVLVIACPCSLGLATPTAVITGIGSAAENGILIKDASCLSLGRKVDTVVLDKTGTLTEGRPEVTESLWDESVEGLRSILLSLESKSEHPLAEAVVASLKGTRILPVEGFVTVPGKGVGAEIGGTRYFAGSEKLLVDEVSDGMERPHYLTEAASQWAREGKSLIYLFTRERLLAVLAVSDNPKPEAAKAVSELRSMGIDVIMLTGDNEQAAASAAEGCGIRTWRSGMLPSDKAEYVASLQDGGHVVAMVGDGINDSAALAKADIGISMGKGSDVAVDSSMMTLVSGDIARIPSFIRLSAKSERIIRENLFWAFFYNVTAVPVAAGALYPAFGFTLNPMIAAACMAASSVCVVLNSLRLLRKTT